MWAGAASASRAPAIFVSRGRRYIKLVCDPHLLYLEAGADHLAGDRALVRLLDSLRHGCDARAQRATRATVAAVLSARRLFLVGGVSGCGVGNQGGGLDWWPGPRHSATLGAIYLAPSTHSHTEPLSSTGRVRCLSETDAAPMLMPTNPPHPSPTDSH